MADDGFNGSTLTFGSAVAGLLSIGVTCDAGTVDTTASDSTVATSVDAVPDYEITAEIIGGTSIAVGAAPAALTISWNDGGSDGSQAGTWRVTRRETRGSFNDKIVSAVTFKPATAPA
ncbi:MAG TPA: hypothetical protein PLS23_21970 [Phycisphaerae bacterium]|mgnify:CR=1 FL=1|nr:hypothetical protein [Phycisphaerae bacterium]